MNIDLTSSTSGHPRAQRANLAYFCYALCVAIGFLSVSLGTAAAPSSLESFFLDTPRPQVLLAEVPTDSVHSRRVQLNPAALSQLEGAGPHRLRLETFRGIQHTVVLNRREDFGPNRFTWSGSLEGFSPSSVTVAVYDTAVALEVQAPGEGLCRLRCTRDGSYWFDEMDPQSPVPCESLSYNQRRDGQPADRLATAGSPAPAAYTLSADATYYVDLLAFYSLTARDQAGGSSAIRAAILKSVALANQAHENSDTHVRFRLVNMVELYYFDSGSLSNDLYSLQAPNDNVIDEVQGLREQFGADLVHLFVTSQGVPGNAQVVGLANLGGDYGVSKWNSAGLVFAHESGHNLGCRHQVLNDKGGTYEHGWEVAHDWYDPTFGFYLDTSKAESVMWASTASTMIPRFSDPGYQLKFSYVFQSDFFAPLGDERIGNNTRFIRENREKKVAVRQPLFFVDSRQPAGGDATAMNPSSTVSTVINTWYERTGPDPTKPVTVNLVSGRYPEAIRITQNIQLRRFAGDGVVHIGAP